MMLGPAAPGPVELGLLLHHPGSGSALGSDHYVVVTGVEDGLVRFHDFAIRVGALQYPLVSGDRTTVARLLRQLAPTYEQLGASLPGR